MSTSRDLGGLMSGSREAYEDFVQFRGDLIDADLIDRVVAELRLGEYQASETITTKLDWTPGCERLREFYVTNIHPNVSAY